VGSLLGTAYYPLRTKARVACVLDNCRPEKRTHGFWALDLLGDTGDPVYAAGYGVVHVGGRFTGCATTRRQKAGLWVWIDHGGGMTSRYYHLSSLAVSDGQLVTPQTRLGAMGRSGSFACRGQRQQGGYLHYEERIAGTHGTRVDPGPMLACVGGRVVTYPDALGSSRWNALQPYVHWPRSDGVDCIPAPERSGRPSVTARRSLAHAPRAAVSWAAPAVRPDLVTGYVVSVQVRRISRQAWAVPEFRYAPAGVTALSLDGLDRKRRYRVRVSAFDANGASPWSDSLLLSTRRRG
jgi:hypothetical protein